MQLFSCNLLFLCALMAASLSLSSAQQIFYPALKPRQISVFANGRLNPVTTVALATPLPATRDAQGRPIIQRQTFGGQRVGAEQFQPVGGQQLQQRGLPVQQFRGPQTQRVGFGGQPFQQFQAQPLQRVGGSETPPIQQFRGQQLQSVGFGGQPFQQFQGQQFLQRGSPIQQFRGQQVQRFGAGGSPSTNFQSSFPQSVGRSFPQVWEQQYDRPVLNSQQTYFNGINSQPYGWQPTNLQNVGK